MTDAAQRRAEELHRQAIIVDLHADPLIAVRAVGYRLQRRHHAPFLARMGFFHTDLPRLREAGVTAQFFGLVTMPYPARGCGSACVRQIRALRRCGVEVVTRAEEIEQAKREGRFVGLVGIEGAHNLEGRLDWIARFAAEGVRYIGLAHFTRNAVCAPCGGFGASGTAPLTDFGRAVVDEMNRCGVLVDLAHVGRAAFLEAARRSRRPVIVSHTGIAAAYPVWRNVDDEQIRAVAETDGVVGIIYAWRYLGGRRGGVEMLAAHLGHVRRLVGARHLALGSDFDGAVDPVQGLESVTGLVRITRLLCELGWRDEEIVGVLGGNVLRVLRASGQGLCAAAASSKAHKER